MSSSSKRSIWALAIHGGAGTLRRHGTHEDERSALAAALDAGAAVLAGGGSSLDAVEAAVRALEDAPCFNAGRGAVYNAVGEHELDASIMSGAGLRAGGVAGVRRVRNPISLARAVMERGEAVLIHSAAAEAFAREAGVALVEPQYFHTARRLAALEEARARAAAGKEVESRDFSTVGAVALDTAGNLAAGTSTGGLTNKPAGRIGDSPVIGAGTYASNGSCAVSATGRGEDILRATVARDIAAQMEYGGRDVASAAAHVIEQRLAAIGGHAGVAAMDCTGRVVFSFNTECMYRGSVSATDSAWIAVGRD